MRRLKIFIPGIALSASICFAQSDVKFEVAHIDLLLLSVTYGGMEMAWKLGMQNAMDNIYRHQTTTDSMFYKMIILEEKTQEYQRQLNEKLMRTLNEAYIDNIINDIRKNQNWFDEYAFLYPDYREMISDANSYINRRADQIRKYIDDAVKKTGNTGRLDNRERNRLHTYVLDELMKLKSYSQQLCTMLFALNPDEKRLILPKLE
jgi:hypothetical protein